MDLFNIPAFRLEGCPRGETHQHTSRSFDAFIFGNRITGPADAYKYYTGETIKHPLGYDIKIETPLDFGQRPRCCLWESATDGLIALA